ncbi:hypothetical protein Tco_1521531, partial [Tanacetum coccineum]
VSFDNGDESFMDITQEELVENVAPSRCEELMAAQEQCVKAEECLKVLDRLEDKPISTIIGKRVAPVDLREGCRQLVIAKLL